MPIMISAVGRARQQGVALQRVDEAEIDRIEHWVGEVARPFASSASMARYREARSPCSLGIRMGVDATSSAIHSVSSFRLSR